MLHISDANHTENRRVFCWTSSQSKLRTKTGERKIMLGKTYTKFAIVLPVYCLAYSKFRVKTENHLCVAIAWVTAGRTGL